MSGIGKGGIPFWRAVFTKLVVTLLNVYSTMQQAPPQLPLSTLAQSGSYLPPLQAMLDAMNNIERSNLIIFFLRDDHFYLSDSPTEAGNLVPMATFRLHAIKVTLQFQARLNVRVTTCQDVK